MLSEQSEDQFQGRTRQNSTPSIFDSPQSSHPIAQSALSGSHRRGLSLDQTITPRNAKLLTRQDTGKPSLEHIFSQHNSQQTVQETQQQLPMARPGHELSFDIQQRRNQPIQKPIAPRPEHGITNEQLANLMNNWDTSTLHSFDPMYNFDDLPDFQLLNPTASAGHLEGFGNGFDDHNIGIEITQGQSREEPPKPTSHEHGSQGAMDPPGHYRPRTPQKQIMTNNLPMTPATTPFSGGAHVHHARNRTADSSPTRKDPQLTIKASHAMQRGGSFQDNFSAMSKHAMSPIPSPPRTAPLQAKRSIDRAEFPALDFFNMSKLQTDVPTEDGGYGRVDVSPLSKATSSIMSSFQSSPETTNMQLFDDFQYGLNADAIASRLSNLTETQSTFDMGSYPSPEKGSLHSRSQSTSELDDLEECVEDTGVTGDEIASFISGPDGDNKWTCLYTDCGKKFGRKENIKSHVQTHLNDRQFRCKQCGKCFVRQHDLKRHANIHTNARLYPCPCGKPFARHDALTRHRQRGMCEGAFEGTPKKIVKRGRPKKTRPETEERKEKAAKTRQRVLERMVNGSTYASSSSASSVYSHASPPEMADIVSMGAASPSNSHRPIEAMPGMEFLSYTPPISPDFTATHGMSRQQSEHSHTGQEPSQATSPVMFQELPMSRQGSGDSVHSNYSALPELELSSSSPAASRAMDFTSSDAGTGSSFTSHQDTSLFTGGFFDSDFSLSQALKSPGVLSNGNFFDFSDSMEATDFHGAMKADNPILSHSAFEEGDLETDNLFRGL